MFNKKNKSTNEEVKEVTNESAKLKATRPIKPQYPQTQKLDTEIEIKTKDIEIKAKGYGSKALIDIINTILGVPTKNDMSFNQLKDIEKEQTKEKPISIDMNKLKDNVRLPRTSNNFRCPTCGQAFITSVISKATNTTRSSWVFRNINSDKAILGEINIEGIDIDASKKEEVIKLYKSLNELTASQVVLVYKDGEECFCPLCGEVHSLKDWILAYDSPLDFFDDETMCDICGKEASLVMTETSSYKECENRCVSKAIRKKGKEEEEENISI